MSLFDEFDDDCDVCSEYDVGREFVKVVTRDEAEAAIAVAT